MFDMSVDLIHTIIEANTPLRSPCRSPLNAALRGVQTELELTADCNRRSALKLCRRQRVFSETAVVRGSGSSTSPERKCRGRRLVVKGSLATITRYAGSLVTDDSEETELLCEHFSRTCPNDDELLRRRNDPAPVIPVHSPA